MTRTIRSILLAAAIAIITPACQAQVFLVHLTGPNESPPNASPGVGDSVITLNQAANTLRVQVSFSGLLGTTTASHIHSATPAPFTGTAGVATTTPTFAGFPLGVTSGTYDNTLNLLDSSSYNPAFVTANGGTVASAEAALINGMLSGESYLNIHTSVVPGGEIRGFLVQAVPEPGAVGLVGGLGVSGAVFALRRRRR